MKEISDGGPAFPRDKALQAPGMTMRQYYMAHAPFTLSDARAVAYEVGEKSPNGDQLIKLLAQMRAGYADAMIAEGSK